MRGSDGDRPPEPLEGLDAERRARASSSIRGEGVIFDARNGFSVADALGLSEGCAGDVHRPIASAVALSSTRMLGEFPLARTRVELRNM
eukprot:4099248-Pyramimonas_sp.AAC.1